MNESRTQQEEALAALAAAHQEIVATERRLASLVASARLAGASWEAVGRALGVSRQAAWKAHATLEERPLSDDAFLPLFTTPQVHTD